MTLDGNWKAFTETLCVVPALDLRVDPSRMEFADAHARVASLWPVACEAMHALEAGSVANPDEQRQVGHYWLRAPQLAPQVELTRAITETVDAVQHFAANVHAGTVHPPTAARFTQLLLIGIGGSALGPQFLAHALGTPDAPLTPHFIDNTDPDGIDLVIATLGSALRETLVLVVSKSGGTAETRNGMLEVAGAFRRANLEFARHAVAITGEGSALHQQAEADGFLATFPMWDWVGGRTSVFSAVGLLPAALLGMDCQALLDGARHMDVATRAPELARNPAGILAACWYHAGNGCGERAMVVLPYKDRLLLFSRYLQQLVMESLGKKENLRGEVVHQGLAVYGNKGSTDQHAFVQQLRDGTDDFFVTFLLVQQDRAGKSTAVDAQGATAGDYLLGFLLGTREALAESGRRSITVTLPAVNARTVGALIALYERAVGFYASFIEVNAYHQPGVEAGKRAASAVLSLQQAILAVLKTAGAAQLTAAEVAERVGDGTNVETVFELLEHAAINGDHGVMRRGATPVWNSTFTLATRG